MAKRKKLQDQNPPRRVEIRGQDHLLAYITPEEAALLKARGGSGEAGPMGIPAFDKGGGGPAGSAGTSGSGATGIGPDDHDADLADSTGAQVGGFADAVGSTIGGLFDMTGLTGLAQAGQKGLEALGFTLAAHDPSAGGGTGGDGFPGTSYMSRYYGGGGGADACPPGYVYNENVGACIKDTGQSFSMPVDGGLLQSLPAGAYARMGLLDMAPSDLEDFAARYGITGYSTPESFAAQNQAFARQRATYPQFYEAPPLMSDLRRVETGDIVAPTGELIPAAAYPVGGILSPEIVEEIAMQTPVTPTPAPVVPAPVVPAPTAIEATPYGRIDTLHTDAGGLSPTGQFLAEIVGLGIDDPLIQAAQERLGPAPGEPWARALNIAAQMPTPPALGFATRGQYLESLGGIGQRLGVVGTKLQDESGRTIGYIGFERPEGDGGDN